MKALQVTFLSFLISSIASSLAQDVPNTSNLNIVNIEPLNKGVNSTCMGSDGSGSPFNMRECDHSGAQNWGVGSAGQNSSILAGPNSCVTMSDILNPGGIASIEPCNQSPNQQFIYTRGGGPIKIFNTIFCLARLIPSSLAPASSDFLGEVILRSNVLPDGSQPSDNEFFSVNQALGN